MSPYRTLAFVACPTVVFMTLVCLPARVVAQESAAPSPRIRGQIEDADSFRGIEEQARRRSKVEADAATKEASAAIRVKMSAEVKQINAESAAEYDQIYSAYREVFLREREGLTQNSGLPVYLQTQFFDIVRHDINRFNAEVQRLKDSNKARIEYATLANQRQNLQILRDAQQHEGAAQQEKLIESTTMIYSASLDRLKESRARASHLNENRESLVRSYNQSFNAFKDSAYREPQGYVGSSDDDYDLAGALRDKLQGMNSGYGH